ncbi:hypothetical protein HJC23_012892 [Cyclotella cryptica]|uniref:Uncharacterized protein n=1 Tax=Cyclotella cryptica TaxID=29204 RepID=A0ABD3Q1E2_9STRA
MIGSLKYSIIATTTITNNDQRTTLMRWDEFCCPPSSPVSSSSEDGSYFLVGSCVVGTKGVGGGKTSGDLDGAAAGAAVGCIIPLSVELPSGIVPFGASVELLTLSSGDCRSGESEEVAEGALKWIVATNRRHSVWVVDRRYILVRCGIERAGVPDHGKKKSIGAKKIK